jgi:hypothetical protein
MKRLLASLVAVAILGTGCGGVARIQTTVDATDRSAYTALRGFQNIEESAWHGHALWPNAAQHRQIGAKLSSAFDLIAKIAAGALALQPGESLPKAITDEMTLLGAAVADIVSLSNTAPPEVGVQAQKAHRQVQRFLSVTKGRR